MYLLHVRHCSLCGGYKDLKKKKVSGGYKDYTPQPRPKRNQTKPNTPKSYYPFVSESRGDTRKKNTVFHLIWGILLLMFLKYFQRVSFEGFSPSNKTAIWLTSCKMLCTLWDACLFQWDWSEKNVCIRICEMPVT